MMPDFKVVVFEYTDTLCIYDNVLLYSTTILTFYDFDSSRDHDTAYIFAFSRVSLFSSNKSLCQTVSSNIVFFVPLN